MLSVGGVVLKTAVPNEALNPTDSSPKRHVYPFTCERSPFQCCDSSLSRPRRHDGVILAQVFANQFCLHTHKKKTKKQKEKK